jgi:hypothetical protein
MFGQNFKASICVLPWFLVPLAVYIIFITVAGPWIDENGESMRQSDIVADWIDNAEDGFDDGFGIDEGLAYDEEFAEDLGDDFFSESDGSVTKYRWEYYKECFALSAVLAIIIGFLLLLIIPCASGFNAGLKKFQFYLGFFIHIAFFVGMPVIFYLFYELDTTTLVILLGMHALLYLGTFLPGARFVSPSYRKAFWF